MSLTVQQAAVKAATENNTDNNTAKPIPHIRLKPTSGWVAVRLGELWEYRELLAFLTWSDFKVRYKQTVLGVAWAELTVVVCQSLPCALVGEAPVASRSARDNVL